MVTTDHHNQNTAEASAQDGADFAAPAADKRGEFVDIEADDTGLKSYCNGKDIEPNDIEESDELSEIEMLLDGHDVVETDGALSTKDRAELEKRYNKKSSRRYRPVLTAAHAYPYTDIMKRHARHMAEAGYSIFPCRPLTFVDTSGTKWKSKAPLTRKGVHDATDDVNQIERWWHWSQYPDAFIGVPTGLKNGFWVLDMDPKNDGITELKKLEAKFGPLPETYTVKTPSGGYHYYFKMPDGIEIKNDAAGKVAPGIDVRGEGGHVIVPPSMRADGRSYERVDNGFLPEECEFAPPWLIELVTSNGSKKAFENVAVRGWAHRILARKCDEVATTDEGSRNETLNKAAFHVGMLVGQRELDRSAAFDALVEAARKCGLEDDEARKTINSGLSSGADEKADQPLFPEWTKFGPKPNSIDNVRAMLSWMGIQLKYNVFTQRAEMFGFQDYTLLNDNAWAELWSATYEVGFQPSKKFLADALEAIALQDKYHPVKDYFESLQWDGVKRLDKLLIDYAGAEDNEYVRAVGSKPLIAAVRRVYVPGTKFDTMPVLESAKQGAGKSTMLRILAVCEEWFADGLSLGDRAKELIEQVEGCLIVEIQELKGVRHSDVDSVKALLSKTHDKARKAYGRFTTNLPRQFVLFATTNPGERPSYLKDKTGNRRFWPVKTSDEIDLASLERDRDQLWAEAVHRHKAGESLILPKRLWDVATAEQEKRVAEHPWVAFLDEHFGDMLGRVLVEDVWSLLGMPEGGRRSQYHVEDLASAMKKLGWEHKQLRKDGKRHYFYVRGAPPYPDIEVVVLRGEKPIVRYAKEKPKDEDRKY